MIKTFFPFYLFICLKAFEYLKFPAGLLKQEILPKSEIRHSGGFINTKTLPQHSVCLRMAFKVRRCIWADTV